MIKNAINAATLNAATIGTANIAGPPINPPNTLENIVTGSNVATDSTVDDDSAAVCACVRMLGVVAANKSVGIVAAFNDVVVD